MIRIELTGATMDQCIEQLREVYSDMVGTPEAAGPAEMNLTDLIEHTKKEAAKAGWQINVLMPGEEACDAVVEDVTSSEDIAVAEIDTKELKKDTIARLKKLLFDKGGPEIVDAIKKKFNCKSFTDQPAERFIEIAAALDEAINA